ncbi:MAG: hypothetical protein J4F40_18675, partial [Alphaproteobacteria bacterium]|nr:hypothetical protein [Alphaproteobacteria bacterium]
YDEPPPFFDKSECVSSCIRGAVYAADFPGGKQQLKCGNADCYNGKLSEGLQRFRDKEQKRAEHVEATRLAIKEGLFPILRGQDELCRYMLKVLIEDGAVTGSPTRPLGYDNLARAVNYHSSGAIRLARELGVPEDKIAGIGGNENLWWTRDAMQMVDELDLAGVATVEALAIALQEAGMTAKDFEPHS